MAFEDEVILPNDGDNIIRTNPQQVFINPKGLAHELYMGMKTHKHKIGQIDPETGKEETFGVMLERSIRVACHLKKLGVTPNDIITPCTTNHLNTGVIFYAILFTGAKVASIDPFVPTEDMSKQLELVEPKLVFAIPENVKIVEKLIENLGLNTKIVLFGKTENHIPFDDFLIPLPDEEKQFTPYIVKDIYETALIVFSSGTTGASKGVCIHHYANLAGVGKFNTGNQPPVFLTYASLVWASAIVTTITTAIGGYTKIQTSGFETEKTWKYLQKYKASICFLAPQDLVTLTKTGKPEGFELPDLKLLCVAGGALSLETITKLREMFPTSIIFTAYAQTELWNVSLAPDLTSTGMVHYVNKPKSCGKPIKGSTYKIVDPETGRVLGPNQPGELCIKSKLNMHGYYKTDSYDRFDKDGFLKTGDIMYYDDDYWFFFVERCKEMLRYKMTAIAPTELEGILIEHPSVKLAVVIGIPTDEGDLATAIIVKKDNNVTAEELENLVTSKVDDRKRLRGGVKFVEENEIPFTPSGKIKRRVLKENILKKMNT